MDSLSADELAQVVDHAAGPDVIAEVNDTWNQTLASLPLVYRAVAVLLREGYTHREVAEKVHLDEKTVGIFVRRLKKKFGIDTEAGK